MQGQAISVLAPLAMLLISAAPAPAAAATGPAYQWARETGPATKSFAWSGLNVKLVARDEEWLSTPVYTIRLKGYPDLTLDGMASNPVYDHQILFGKWEAGDPGPSVILQGYSGGAHCCAEATLVRPIGGRLTVISLGSADGEGLTAFPRDIDGDGRRDIARLDDRFLYAFGSYGGSWAPPAFFNVVGTRLIDVSTRPGFRALFVKDAAKARVLCMKAQRGDERNGACAGYVASSARAGNFAAAWKAALPKLAQDGPRPSGCAVKVEYSCPDDQEIRYRTTSEALQRFLKDLGYIS